MLDFITQYSGIVAIVGYSIILVIILKIKNSHQSIECEKEDKTSDHEICPLDLNDEDATVACLIASIEERTQTGKNVQVISVREVK